MDQEAQKPHPLNCLAEISVPILQFLKRRGLSSSNNSPKNFIGHYKQVIMELLNNDLINADYTKIMEK